MRMTAVHGACPNVRPGNGYQRRVLRIRPFSPCGKRVRALGVATKCRRELVNGVFGNV